MSATNQDRSAEVIGKKNERLNELEAEVERLRGTIQSIKIWLCHVPEYKRGKQWDEMMWHVKDALYGSDGDND